MGKGDIDEDDEDMADAVLLAIYEWSPSTLEDIASIPVRTLDLYQSFRKGMHDGAKLNREG